jgi:oligopeptide/dipeptide ABC transporter ATP-binding protein
VSLLEVDHLRVDLPVEGAMQTVIHDVTLSIGEGEAVGLVGESGAGKSMAARSVLRLLPPGARTRGEISFAGDSIPRMDAGQLRHYRMNDVAMIFQDPRAHINPVRTIGDFLTEALISNLGTDRAVAEEKVIALLRDVGIEDAPRRLGQHPFELSGGLLQRAMIAAAMATEPRLILADEPTTALDVTTQSEVMAILDEQRRQRGLAMLFITHDLELAAAVCDRIGVMYAGFLVEDRDAGSLHARAMHPYTAGLLAARPDPRRRTEQLWAIPGRPLSAFEVHEGCPFVSRCAFVEERCRVELPEVRELDGGRVRCHRAEELRDQLTDRSRSAPDG